MVTTNYCATNEFILSILNNILSQKILLNKPTTAFNTISEYKLPDAANVKISIYDIIGKLVEKLVNEYRPVGSSFVTWNSVKIPSGVYFYRVKAGDYTAVKKCILMK